MNTLALQNWNQRERVLSATSYTLSRHRLRMHCLRLPPSHNLSPRPLTNLRPPETAIFAVTLKRGQQTHSSTPPALPSHVCSLTTLFYMANWKRRQQSITFLCASVRIAKSSTKHHSIVASAAGRNGMWAKHFFGHTRL